MEERKQGDMYRKTVIKLDGFALLDEPPYPGSSAYLLYAVEEGGRVISYN